jgi:hypothetical protein
MVLVWTDPVSEEQVLSLDVVPVQELVEVMACARLGWKDLASDAELVGVQGQDWELVEELALELVCVPEQVTVSMELVLEPELDEALAPEMVDALVLGERETAMALTELERAMVLRARERASGASKMILKRMKSSGASVMMKKKSSAASEMKRRKSLVENVKSLLTSVLRLHCWVVIFVP